MENEEEVTMRQGTEEWFTARRGRVTASRINDVMAKTKTGTHTAGYKNYMSQIIAERLTGETEVSFCSPAMQWGIEKEALARVAYEWVNDVTVLEVGFKPHPNIGWSGASPDGLVGDDGMVELKCPNTATHIATLLGGSIPKKYKLQMQWQMDCETRRWCDYVSFDPRLPLEIQMHIQRVDRDDKLINEIAASISQFLAEVHEKIEKLKGGI